MATPERNWQWNRKYWDDIHLRFDSDDRKWIFFYAMLALKVPTGIESVENTFSLIKIIHRARRANLGPRKLRELIYIVGNYKMLKRLRR